MSDSLIGQWHLIGSAALQDEIKFVGEEPDPHGVESWLAGNSYAALGSLTPTTGLALTIQADGRFQEEKVGDPRVEWFSDEGVLENSVKPFGGVLSLVEGITYLLLAEPISWATPSDPLARRKLRYDDGDTKIADWIELLGAQLVRTISVSPMNSI